MNLQLITVLGLVAMAAGAVVWNAWRTWFGRKAEAGCGHGCGSCAAVAEAPPVKGRIRLPQV